MSPGEWLTPRRAKQLREQRHRSLRLAVENEREHVENARVNLSRHEAQLLAAEADLRAFERGER